MGRASEKIPPAKYKPDVRPPAQYPQQLPPRDNLVEIRLERYTVFLTPAEINRLLVQDPVLFATAVQRGKGILRGRQARARGPNRTR